MIEFLTEAVRKEFQQLSSDLQKEYYDIAISFAQTNQYITILCIDRWGKEESELEVSIRIDEKPNSFPAA